MLFGHSQQMTKLFPTEKVVSLAQRRILRKWDTPKFGWFIIENVYMDELRVPSCNLTLCSWTWRLKSWFFPVKIVIFPVNLHFPMVFLWFSYGFCFAPARLPRVPLCPGLRVRPEPSSNRYQRPQAQHASCREEITLHISLVYISLHNIYIYIQMYNFIHMCEFNM